MIRLNHSGRPSSNPREIGGQLSIITPTTHIDITIADIPSHWWENPPVFSRVGRPWSFMLWCLVSRSQCLLISTGSTGPPRRAGTSWCHPPRRISRPASSSVDPTGTTKTYYIEPTVAPPIRSRARTASQRPSGETSLLSSCSPRSDSRSHELTEPPPSTQ
jgi:hypothetical protein